jgi:hypothetical protein
LLLQPKESQLAAALLALQRLPGVGLVGVKAWAQVRHVLGPSAAGEPVGLSDAVVLQLNPWQVRLVMPVEVGRPQWRHHVAKLTG